MTQFLALATTTTTTTLLFLLLFSHHALSIPTTTITGARIWTHFYPSCSTSSSFSEAGLTPPLVDVLAGTCTEVTTPSPDSDQVDYISIDAELVVVAQPSQSQQCNVTVHEVPGCVDPPLIEAPVRDDRRATSGCAERNFKAYSAVWVRLDCAEAGRARRWYHSSVRRDDAVRRRRPNRV